MKRAGPLSYRGEEIAEGVFVERRHLLQSSLATLLALSLGFPKAASAGREMSTTRLSLDSFVEEVVPMAEALIQSRRAEEENYLLWLSRLAARLRLPAKAGAHSDDEINTASLFYDFPFAIVRLRLKPRAVIAHHDHRDYNGVLRVIRGQVQVRSFAMLGADRNPLRGKTFLIRETNSRHLFPEQCSSLSTTRDNIHCVRAGEEGAELLDFFTFFRKQGQSFYLDVDETPRDAKLRTYEASWV